MQKNSNNLGIFRAKLQEADAIVIGAGAGLSASGGLLYHGARFVKYFADFQEAYGINHIYSGGFYPFSTAEERWGWWCRHIYYNRYAPEACEVYETLYGLVKDKDYFVLTTNVDHQFQKAGFASDRLCYTQGDYGLFQCSVPCTQETFSNETAVREMIAQQKGRFVPTELVPKCPHCGAEMTPNLRKDHLFAEPEGLHHAFQRYRDFLNENLKPEKKLLLLELGVGFNTPGIIKQPFCNMVYEWENVFLISVNQDNWRIPKEIATDSLLYQGDISEILKQV